MAAIIWADVEAHAPELSLVGATAQDDILAYVNDAFDVEVFGGEDTAKTRLARIYLAAHMGTITNSGGGATGPVTSESAGGLSRTYGEIDVDGSMESTSYGELLSELIRSSAARAPIVI